MSPPGISQSASLRVFSQFPCSLPEAKFGLLDQRAESGDYSGLWKVEFEMPSVCIAVRVVCSVLFEAWKYVVCCVLFILLVESLEYLLSVLCLHGHFPFTSMFCFFR